MLSTFLCLIDSRRSFFEWRHVNFYSKNVSLIQIQAKIFNYNSKFRPKTVQILIIYRLEHSSKQSKFDNRALIGNEFAHVTSHPMTLLTDFEPWSLQLFLSSGGWHIAYTRFNFVFRKILYLHERSPSKAPKW